MYLDVKFNNTSISWVKLNFRPLEGVLKSILLFFSKFVKNQKSLSFLQKTDFLENFCLSILSKT